MLKKRIITALIGIPIVLFIIFWMPVFPFALFMTAIIAIGAWEWSKLVGYKSFLLRLFYTFAVVAALFCVRWMPLLGILFLGFFAMLWALSAIIAYQYNKAPMGFQFAPVRVILGFLLLVPTWVAMVAVKATPNLGGQWILILLLIIWATDTGAYFSGRLWGKRKLIDRVSPKKTWIGVAGGLALSLVVVLVTSYFTHFTWQRNLMLYALAILVSLFSVIGDLNVSLLKRISGIKDSGTIFPGHGGMLDRIDSIIGGAIVFAIGIGAIL